MKKEKIKKNEKNNVKTYNKKKITLISFIIIIFITTTLIAAYFEIKNLDTYNIANSISKNLYNSSVKKNEKDNIFEYSYQESYSIYLNSNDEILVEIQKFNSNFEAEKKLNFIKERNNLYHKNFDNTFISQLDEYKSIIKSEKDIKFVKGIYFITINDEIKNLNTKNNINKILKKYDLNDIYIPNKEKINNYWNKEIKIQKEEFKKYYKKRLNEKNDELLSNLELLDKCKGSQCDEIIESIKIYENYSDLKETIDKIKNKYDEVINNKNNKINEINNKINNLKVSLNQDDFDNIKKEITDIKNLNDSFYDDYIQNFENELNILKEPVYKHSCNNFYYKNLLRNPDEYLNQRAYFFGKILQKINYNSYRIGVDCTEYQYIGGYHCDNTIYVTYNGDVSLIEDDMVKIWGEMNGNQTYTTIMNASVTIPKLYAKYIELQ